MSKKWSVLLLTVVMIASLAGCGRSGGASAGTDAGSEKVDIIMLRIGNEQDPRQDRMLLELQKRVNIELEIITVGWGENEKVRLMMASQDRIDLLNYDPGTDLNDWVKNGLMYSFDELIGNSGKYPLVNAVMNSEVYKNLKIDGKAYCRPMALAPQHWGFMIRQDWLDNLGMSIPTNIDELYDVMYAFTYGDPDMDGQDNTVAAQLRFQNGGASGHRIFGYIHRAFALSGGTGTFTELADGSLVAWEASDNARESSRFIQKIIADGLINRDFLNLSFDNSEGLESDDFALGRFGIAHASVPSQFLDKLREENPDGKIVQLAPIQGVNGVPANEGHSGGFWRASMIPKTSKHPQRVLDLLEYTHTFEGRELTMYGVEGVNFTEKEFVDGTWVYTLDKDECAKDWNIAANGFVYPLSWDGFNYWEHAYLPISENNYDYDKAFANIIWLKDSDSFGEPLLDNFVSFSTSYAKPRPLMNVMDEELLADATKLNAIFEEGWIKAVMASANDFDGIWDAIVSDYLSNGGQARIDRANALYGK